MLDALVVSKVGLESGHLRASPEPGRVKRVHDLCHVVVVDLGSAEHKKGCSQRSVCHVRILA